MPNAYSLWRVDGNQQGFRSAASFGFGGQESASKPPQAICKPLAIIENPQLKKITEVQHIGNGKTKVNFKFPITLFEFLFLFILGIALIVLAFLNINISNTLIANILIGILGAFGLLLFLGFISLIALNFRTLTINNQTGTAVFNKCIGKTFIQIDDISHVLIKKKKNSGLTNSNGAIQGPDSIASSIHLQLKSGKLIKLIPVKGVGTFKKNANGKLIELSKNSAKDIAELLSVKILTD